jgi:hypothetical protein
MPQALVRIGTMLAVGAIGWRAGEAIHLGGKRCIDG